MTATVMPRRERQCGRARLRRLEFNAGGFADIFEEMFGEFTDAGAAARRAGAAPICATT